MPRYYISSTDFRDSLNNWLATGSNTSLNQIAKNRVDIPEQFRKTPDKLFLPMSVDEAFINSANLGRASFDFGTVWTKDEQYARNFFRIPRNRTTNKFDILITKYVERRHQILDVGEFVTFFGIPQLEMLGFKTNHLAMMKQNVIVSKEILISRADYTILSQPESDQRGT